MWQIGPFTLLNLFKNGSSKIFGRQPLNLKGYGLLKLTISTQIFKGCLSHILIGPFLYDQ